MNNMTLYLDMDGVICDFHTAYSEIQSEIADEKKFHIAVKEYNIFSRLKPMPDAKELLESVACLPHIQIEILTSVGTWNKEIGDMVRNQKTNWLHWNNIPHKPNFVRCKAEKADYASDKTILIDDSIGCVEPFISAGGHGILHTSASTSMYELQQVFNKIKKHREWTT